MEINMRKIMEQSWREWHGVIGTEHALIPAINSSYHRGFSDCHDALMPLLIESAPHVFASHGAAHLVDGFRPQRRPIDDLVERIKAVLPE